MAYQQTDNNDRTSPQEYDSRSPIEVDTQFNREGSEGQDIQEMPAAPQENVPESLN